MTDNEIEAAIDIITERLNKVNSDYIKLMGEHVKKIGSLTATDVHRLEQMKIMGANIESIQKELVSITEKNISDLLNLYKTVAQDDYRLTDVFYKAVGITQSKLSKNNTLKNYIESVAKQTAHTYKNLSNTTVISDTYKDIIDNAVTITQSGMTDYQAAIRSALKKAGGSGIQVEYESGNRRRLDTAVRMNTLEGVRMINQGVAEQTGKEFGADGVEISVHANPAPDHAQYQGRQYTNKQFEQLQKTLERPIGTLNCTHFATPVIMGISQPTYSQDQLDEITAKNDKGCMIDGKHYSMYEAEQLQRRIETEVRRQKDIANIAKAAGDDNLRRNAQGNINMLNKKYIQVCKASGLPSQKERMAVSDYRRISLTKIRKKPIIDSGAISGARNPFSKEAEDHAIKYYNSVRKMSTDIQKISKNTGIDISDITEIKKYIFYDEHDLGEEGSSLFDPDYMMAQSWQRLIEGTDIQQHDITLLKHELSEKKLVEKGFTQSEAHIQASKAYNYAKEEEKYYAEINKHYKK